MKTKPYVGKQRIGAETAAEYQALAERAKAIQESLDALVMATLKAEIPDTAKCNILEWIHRAGTFRGLSYFLTPQTEWTGGDSMLPENFVTMNPHIAR